MKKLHARSTTPMDLDGVFSLVATSRQEIDRIREEGFCPQRQMQLSLCFSPAQIHKIKHNEEQGVQFRLAMRLKERFTKSQLLELMNTLGLSNGLDVQKSKARLFIDIAGVLLGDDGQSAEEEEAEEEGEEEEEGDPELSADEAEEPAAASVRAPCAVCLEAMPDRLVKPCNHLALCCKCAAQVKRERPPRCPLCRAVIVKIEKVFL